MQARMKNPVMIFPDAMNALHALNRLIDEAELEHWQFEDPFAALDHTQRKRMFQSLRDQIAQRVRLFAFGPGSICHTRDARSSQFKSFE